jgi:hypothetical protein
MLFSSFGIPHNSTKKKRCNREVDVDTELCKNNSYKMIVNNLSFLIDGRSMLTLLLMGSLNGVELGGSDDDLSA